MPPERPGARDADRETAPRQEQYEGYASAGDPSAAQDPDVVLDVPVLNVEELDLEVDSLEVRVSVQAELADMVKLNVGVDAKLGKAKLGVKGVEAQALLKVRLDNIRAILEQALHSIDRDPSIIERLAGGSGRTDRETGDAAGHRESRVGNATEGGDEDGRTVRRTIDESGNVLKTVLDGAGKVVEEDAPDTLADLPLEQEYLDDEGRIVGRVRDDAGNLVEEELDEEGNVVGILGFVGADGTRRDEVEATAPAERRARELGVDLSAVDGTGSGGRILVKDVERAANHGA